jgi:hypothetical protein
MLIFGAIILAAAVAVDHWLEVQRRARMDAWRRKRNEKKDKDNG